MTATAAGATASHPAADRTARRRHYLMCRPSYFDVTYSINPWMDPAKPVDTALAVAQWQRLHLLYQDLGHRVELIEPVPGLPDMVFTANGATVVAGRVLVARFRHQQRAPEARAHQRWFRKGGYREIQQARWRFEGEGDLLVTGSYLLAGTGFRSEPHAHQEAQELFGLPAIGLALVDPRFYHLDTALAVLDHDEIMYYPGAFSPGSRRLLDRLFPDAIRASARDAEVFGLNAVSDGRNVVLPEAAVGLAGQLAERGFTPIGVDVSELHKAGGAVKCCTLELRDL